MYSPKIREDLIPPIYKAAKELKIPMTVWVNQTLERALARNPEELNEKGPQNEYGRDTKTGC